MFYFYGIISVTLFNVCLHPQLFFTQLLVALTQQVWSYSQSSADLCYYYLSLRMSSFLLIFLPKCIQNLVIYVNVLVLHHFSVDGSHHTKFHETTRGEVEGRVTVELEKDKIWWCLGFLLICGYLLSRTWICPGWLRDSSD